MVACFVIDCSHYSERGICKMFRFPRNPTIRAKWASLVGRTDREPTINSMICSCHFVNKDRNNLPTLFGSTDGEVSIKTTSMKTTKKLSKIVNFDITSPLGSRILLQRSESNISNIPIQEKDSPLTKKHRKSADKENSQEADITFLPAAECSNWRSQSRISDAASEQSVSDIQIEGSEEEQAHHSRSSSKLLDEFEQLGLQRRSAIEESDMYFFKKENEELKEKLKKLSCTFSFEHIQHSDKIINAYTGFPNKYLFETVFSLFENKPFQYYLGWSVVTIPKRDQFLILLMKLRLNLLHIDLATRFNCSVTTISNIVQTWLFALHETLYTELMSEIPSRFKNKTCMPACFSTFTNCRIIIDCTEMRCHKPKSMVKQKETYSSYKHYNSVKGLVGVAPNGVVTFLSELFPGSVSDKKIVERCGILKKLAAGDLILADKGFLISDLLPPGVSLNIPPFLTTPQFCPEQVVQTRTIARARIHVERAISRIKCYSILDAIPVYLAPYATIVFQVCGALTNMQFPLIAEVEDLYKVQDE